MLLMMMMLYYMMMMHVLLAHACAIFVIISLKVIHLHLPLASGLLGNDQGKK